MEETHPLTLSVNGHYGTIPIPNEGGDIRSSYHDNRPGASVRNLEDVQRWRGDVMQRQDITDDGFLIVEPPRCGDDTYGDRRSIAASSKLEKTVLGPYYLFLIIIGWRSFSPPRYGLPNVLKCAYNWLWPVALTIILIASCIVQILLCFGRDSIKPNPPVNNTYYIDCRQHIVSYYVILDILLVSAFLYGLYVFRIKEVQHEHLSVFSERAILGVIVREGEYSSKYLMKELWFLLAIGLIWIIYSFLVSIVRIFAHHYFSFNYTIHLVFLPDDIHPVMRMVMVIISEFGFVVIDVAFTAVFLNYSIRCELMIYYFQGICSRVNNKEWEIDQAIEEINNARRFLSTLNSHMARATSIMLFILLFYCFNALFGLEELMNDADDLPLIAVTGVLSVIQWTTVFFLPLIQAARVTHSGYMVKETALEIRSHPFGYENTQRYELDSFVIYCSNLTLTANLVSVPISPALVLGFSFILGFVLYLVLGIDNNSFLWTQSLL